MISQEGKKGYGLVAIILAVGVALGLMAGVVMGLWRTAPDFGDLASPQAITARRVLVTVNATGDAGQAGGTGNSDEMVRGQVVAVYLDYTAGISTTTDLTLRGKNAPYDTILSLADTATDVWVYPRRAVQDYTGADVTYDGTRKVYEPFMVDDYLTAIITQSTWTTPTVKVYVFWR